MGNRRPGGHLSDFAIRSVYYRAHSEPPAQERARMGLRAGISRDFPSAGLNFWYPIRVQGEKDSLRPLEQIRFPAREPAWRKDLLRRIRMPRAWDASQESLRTSLVKTHRRVTALIKQFHLLRCIFTGSLRRLLRCIGGGFRFPPPPMSEKGASSQGDKA